MAGWDEGVIGGMDLWAKFLEEDDDYKTRKRRSSLSHTCS